MTTLDKPRPLTKPQTLDGNETAIPIVPPSLFGAAGLPWADADDHFASTQFEWQQAQKFDGTTSLPWSRLSEFNRALEHAWRQADQYNQQIALPWSRSTPYALDGNHPWRQATPHQTDATTPWQQFRQQLAAQLGLPWITPDAHSFDTVLPWATLAAQSARASLVWKRLAELGAYVALPWGTGSNYQTGYTNPFVNPPDDGSPWLFPDLPVYIMIPTLTAVVIDGGADLKPLAVTINEDVDSWSGSFEMQIPAETLALINPGPNVDPIAIRDTVNGYPWSFLVESYTDNRKFGARGFTVRGRSQSALFDNMPSRTLLQTDDYNIAQLAQHEVDPTGWTVIWDAIDWLVPGGTWTYNDLTPIAAIQELARQAGAVVLTDPDSLNIHVAPRYSAKPWEWDTTTPYAIIPAAALDGVNGDWRGGNNANGIYVYAKNSASGALVRITGTAGDVPPHGQTVITEILLVDHPSQEQRGTQELAKAGRAKRETITIPLLPAPASPGLIPLRALLEITDETGSTYRAQVMARQIQATRSGGALSVRQNLTIERQFRS